MPRKHLDMSAPAQLKRNLAKAHKATSLYTNIPNPRVRKVALDEATLNMLELINLLCETCDNKNKKCDACIGYKQFTMPADITPKWK